MANYFVTGGAGFIGRHFVERLLAAGHRVVCLTRRPTENRPAVKGLTWLEADLCESDKYADELSGSDYVVHMAGIISSRRIEDYQRVNVSGTDALLRTCSSVSGPKRRFLHMSSIAAVGPRHEDRLLTETDTPQPESEYGMSKRRAERIVVHYSNMIRTVILRPSFIYGPGDLRGLEFLRLFLGGADLASSSVIRSICLCHVADLVDACVLALESEVASGRVYHISDPKVYTWQDVHDTLTKILRELGHSACTQGTESEGPATGATEEGRWTGRRLAIHKYWGCDISRARCELGFAPRYTLAAGARETIHWYLDNDQMSLPGHPGESLAVR